MQKQSKPQPTPYPLDELLRLWEAGTISMEQLCGQLLIWSQRLHERLLVYERGEENVHHELADLNARVTDVEETLSQDGSSEVDD